ncbi:hypothetical protein D3C85_1053010 [compost metagenome]
MGFVDQHRDLPVIGPGQTEQQGAEIEVVVVVGNHYIGPSRHFLAQVIGTDIVCQGNLAQGALVQQTQLTGRLPCGGQAIVEPPGQWAGLAVAGFVRMFAGLVPGNHFQHPQRWRIGAGQQHLRGVQGQLASRGFRCQEEHFVQLLRCQCLEHGKQGAQGLADARGRLRHQAAPCADGLEHRLGQMALPRPKIGVRKGQALRREIAPVTMDDFLLRPLQEARALPLEELLQLRGLEGLDQAGFLFTDDVEIHQRQVDPGQIQLAAHQPAVDFRLGPMQLTVVGRLFAQVTAVGLDLFQAVLPRVIAIRPALDRQGLILALKGDFTLVTLAAPRGHRAVPDNALQRSGRRREAQVEVADLGGELAQRPHRNAVAQASCSAHCT